MVVVLGKGTAVNAPQMISRGAAVMQLHAGTDGWACLPQWEVTMPK